MQMLRVANHLEPDSIRVDLALARAGGEYEPLVRAGIPVHHLAPRRLKSSTLALTAAMGPLRRLVREIRPDVVCSFMDGVSVASTLALEQIEGTPRLVACVQNTPTHAYARSRNPVRRLILAMVQRTYPRVDRVVALSRGVADDLIQHVPSIASRVEVIHNAGLDDTLLDRARQPLANGLRAQISRPLIVACGRLMPQKGYPVLLEAFARLRPDTGAHLWIVGEGPQRSYLERRIAALGLGGSVRMFGFQSNPYPYMSAADVFVVPSLWEGFGNVIVEAMATGRPVVASDCPHGPSEIVTDGTNGLLVRPGDVHDLERALRRVLGDHELAARLGASARGRALDFHARTIAASYASLFHRLVARA